MTPGSSEGIRRALREQAGLDILTLRPASGGESRTAFWVQERLPGTVLDPGARPAAVAGLVPELIRLNDAQEGLGTGPGGWPGLLLQTLRTGGDGYCVHATLEARADTREMLRAVLAGDRAFDLATMLFYCYDHDDLRARLRARLRELASPPTIRVYLAHMVLRQVDWSLRYHPAAAATQRHLRLARLVMADIAD